MSEATSRSTSATEISAEELAALLGTEEEPLLLDVREPDEFATWAIAGARNVPLSTLADHLTEIDGHRDVVVVCASGRRSASAAVALEAGGIHALSLAGGMTAWSTAYDTAEMHAGRFAVVQVRRRGKGCLSYLVGSGDEATVVDPSTDAERYLGIASEHGWRITRVVDTHLHADHVSGARGLVGRTGATLHMSPGDPLRYHYEPLEDGQSLSLGEAAVRVLSTPGHTKGSVVLDLDGKALLTGDTLFVDGVGRPDLADHAQEYATELYHSLHDLVLDRPDDLLVLPAHYSDAVRVRPGAVVTSRLGDVRSAVPQLAWDEDQFVAWASTRATARPPRYSEIVRVNAGETTASGDEARALEAGPNRCAAA